MPFSLEDKEGRPWIASTNLGWVTLATVLTIGIAGMLLALYLSLWIRSKGRSVLPLIGFLFVASGSAVISVLGHFSLHGDLSSSISDLVAISWIAATFSLRHEIKRYYKESEGWDIEIGPFFTFFFSAIYINYCLNPVTLSEKGQMTSLNLRK
jgi:hypothetical protein